ncbi:MAG: NAD(P)-dependent oxidoreductase [Hyphomicrobiaceae bacterium]|nr:NAD(P)-dependent oxidoreductase [Hyphomicrobiaceae bacterium]MCC0024065.1 NAD(P)-dependent oxidoreductase [Hyphomicrobiaceae bacterium]
MKKIVVTGGSGSPERGVGASIVRDLLDRGYEVRNLDILPPRANPQAEYRQVDLSHYGDTFANLHGADAVVHLAANAKPDFDHFTGAQRFHLNTLMAYNVFQSAVALGIDRVVWASSETVLGFPYDTPPELVPTHDDDPPIPTGSYGISKAVVENLAEHLHRLHGTTFIGLRFSNVYYDNAGSETDYQDLPPFWDKPKEKKFNLWGYVDHRDIAQGVYRALTSSVTGARNYTLAAADTNMKMTNEELVALCFPGTRIRPGTGAHDTLIGIDRAREELGYDPQYSWRDILGEN